MKELKKLNIDELTTRQKLGMTMVGHIYNFEDYGINDPEAMAADAEYVYELIRNHSLGAVWIDTVHPQFEEVMKKVHEIADYPILIMRDAEFGLNHEGKMITTRNAIGVVDDTEIAYSVGKSTAICARKQGFNVVCNPVVDMCEGNAVCNSTGRSLGSDKYKVTRLAAAEAQGMKDAGVLTVVKHYPSSKSGNSMIDGHMASVLSTQSKEDLIENSLYPYIELNNQGLMDGIMVGHSIIPSVDPEYPASLSQKVIGLIREQGFDGFAVTDAMTMMGIASKFGAGRAKALAVANGNDLSLIWHDNKESYEAICEAYDEGVITDERLDEATRRVLEAQAKTMVEPKFSELTEEDMEKCEASNRDSVFAKTDEGLTTGIDTNGKHFFVVLAENEVGINNEGELYADTFQGGWHNVGSIVKKLEDMFPNSYCRIINNFPTPIQTLRVLEDSVEYDDVVYITFVDAGPCIGKECFTSRIIDTITGLQITDRVSTVVHFGNPYALEDLPHIPRVIIGTASRKGVDYTLDVLAGKYPAKGKLTYDVKFN